ncbi:MAG: RluA family pseudouridine synthase [Pseudomonadota bacterium]|nr:RluA family pseudouridine synthase [Pseudomonadota bacterium]
MSSEDSLDPGTVSRGVLTLDQAGQRLDRVLADLVPDLSRSRLKTLIEKGHVRLDGQTIVDASYRVKQDQVFEVTVPPPEAAVPQAQDIPLKIVYEDEHLLVIDKPPGLVVHPAAGNADSTLVNALLHHCGDSLSGIGGVKRPGIVHRLDKDTSGLMVVAKTDAAHQALSGQFGGRTISRTYHALVQGIPAPASGRIEGAIGRHPVHRKKMAVVNHGGKPAATLYRTLRVFGRAFSLVECTLLTGRTHQIRVHMTSIGHPLAGDPLYGRISETGMKGWPVTVQKAVMDFPRQALHAVALKFEHPATGETLQFTSPYPDDLRDLLGLLEE